MEFDIFKYNLSDEEKKWLGLVTKEDVRHYESLDKFGKLGTVVELLRLRGKMKEAEKMIKESDLSTSEKITLWQTLYFDVLDVGDDVGEDGDDDDDDEVIVI